MTTYIDFAPTTTAPFQFQATLDGSVYNVIITWGLFGRRPYVNVVNLNGGLIVSLPLAGSPVGIEIQSTAWANGYQTAVLVAPHGLHVGSSARITVDGCTPAAINGTVYALAVDPTTLSWPLPANPGPATALGTASRNLNLVGGYFSSSLVYRTANAQFEISS